MSSIELKSPRNRVAAERGSDLSSELTRSAIRLRPLSGSIGTEVDGVRLSDEVDQATFSQLHEAFLASCGVLVFRDQFLSPAAQHEFATKWGSPLVMPHLARHAYPGYIDVLKVTNLGKGKAGTENWHCDSIFLTDPPAITILAAQELPEAGGDTMWANQYLAYERLSPGMQSLLASLKGRFIGSGRSETGESIEVVTSHPIVRTHPETQRKSLLVGHPGDSLVSIEDMTAEESRPLLDYLYTHATQPDLVYRHNWRAGDVVMWDNRCTLHSAVHDYGDSTRTLSRVTLRVEQPAVA
jgi:taurine dioxygenase